MLPMINKRIFGYTALMFFLILSAACSNSPQSAQKKIDTLAKNMKAELPKMLDRDTKLINVYTRKLELISEYELVNYKPTESGNQNIKNKIKLYLKTQVCPAIKDDLLNDGISSRYIYKGKDSQVIGEWLIAPGDC